MSTARIPDGTPRLAWAAPVAAYIGAIVAANWLTVRYGFIAVAPGLAATAGTYAAGCAFVFRNLTQEMIGRWLVLAAIGAGAVLSWFLASPTLAIASGVAFVCSETTDWAIYTPLRRHGWVKAAAAGNVAGFMADTFLFLWLAHFAILANAPGQLLGKFYATGIYIVIGLVVSRALLHPAVNTARP